MSRLCWDIEAKDLLTSDSVDYLASPYKLKDPEFIHCAVFEDIDTGEETTFVQDEVYKYLYEFLMDTKVTELIGHNTISYDHLVLKAALGLDYTVGPDTIGGRPVIITDTMVLSKTLNPDRPGHSIDYLGRMLGLEKIDWRAKAIEIGLIPYDAPKGAEFKTYHPEMLIYNRRDVKVNIRVYNFLMKEWGNWDWSSAYALEKDTREIITRQEQRGFWFNAKAAEDNVRELDKLMDDIRRIVEPALPPKPLGKTKAKAYIPPLKQFKQNMEPNAHIRNFVEKHGGTLEQDGSKWKANIFDKEYTLPIPQDPIVTEEPATVKDTTHIKSWLVQMGWSPSQYKERDLTVDFKKKKLTREKFIETAERYIEQTLNSPFCQDRCDELETTPAKLRNRILNHDFEKRPLKVYTNPTLTVGMEKEIDPNLLLLADKFPHAKTVSEYLTYSHRRNSILGGGVDPDDEDEEMEKGFLSSNRIAVDGRIPTPADTCGAGTSRFKHRLVANIPRVTSLYGKQMRSLFGVDTKAGFIQMAFDFDSLEAKIESHYVYKYPGGPEYGVSLTAEKPNDCHSVLASSISELLGRTFPRGTAKNVKYGCSYNAQPKRVAKTVGCDEATGQIIFNAFWEQAYPLRLLKEKMQQYWETTGQKKFLLGLDGRKLPIRSKGNVINTAFQSAGVICAKRAMVIFDRKLKAEGLSVDFWLDDWKNKDFCQQLIAYHDEQQHEVRAKSITWKTFPVKDWSDDAEVKKTEAEAKALKKELEETTGKVWSDVQHTDKMYYFGYNRSGELAIEAVVEAGKYYKLNVDLSAGYMLGRNWAECH